jgi:hypothetical protein
LFIVTYNGRTLVTSREKMVPDLDLSDRDHYEYLIEHDDNGASISEPVESRVFGTPMIYLARRIRQSGVRCEL